MAKQPDEVHLVFDKKSARDQIFSPEYTKPKTANFTFNGVELQVRQPSVAQFMEAQIEGDKRAFIVRMLIDHSYILGTEEKPFEESDYDTLVAMPFNKAWQDVSAAIQQIIDINLEEKVKN